MLKTIATLLFFSISAFAQSDVLKPVASTIDGNNVDSIAVWHAPKRENSLILVTEKEGGSVMVFKADRSAAFVKRVGGLVRPNGVVVLQNAKLGKKKLDLAFVTERDANRVSVFSLPDFAKLGEFANGLMQPMGISVYQRKNDIVAFIVPKRAEGNEKVQRFRVTELDGKLNGTLEKTFGSEMTVDQETIYFDPKMKIVYAADETAGDIKIYDADGNFQKSIGKGIFQAQVEGIAIADCGNKRYLLASDQLPANEFEVFELPGLNHRGTIVGTASRTDGIALTTKRLADFKKGLFLAQTDPDDTGGLRVEYYDLAAFFAKLSIKCR